MRIRITSVDELQFLLCIQYGFWGSKSARFKDWEKGDYLAILVDKAVAGLAQVSGEPIQSRERIWTKDVYPHRIPVKFLRATLPDNRLRVLGEIRDELTSEWGPSYGWGILNQRVIEGVRAEKLVRFISESPNDLQEIKSNLAELQAKSQGTVASIDKQKPEKSIRKSKSKSSKQASGKGREESAHDRIQLLLKKLGQVTGCQVWIAANDQGRVVGKQTLGEGCLKKLPGLGLNNEAQRRISLIDVLWVQKDAPLFAFEVEDTTSVYSGLLRMADLMAEVPNLRINFFIVAPADRRDKVLSELGRPTFRKIGLSDYCSYITYGDLEELLKRIDGFVGHVQPSIIKTVASGVEGNEESI